MIANTPIEFLFLFLSAFTAGSGWALGHYLVGKLK